MMKTVKCADRVTVNVETFCGECFFCQHGFVNNCTDPNGGWALGCRIDGGADVVLEVAGAKDTFRLAWECARPNAIVTVVALYDEAQSLPFPEMYGKNLYFLNKNRHKRNRMWYSVAIQSERIFRSGQRICPA